MEVWHATTLKKLDRYRQMGRILPPVRAWVNFEAARQFSLQTGRRVILRLNFPENKVKQLEGHQDEAVFIDESYPIFGNRLDGCDGG